MMRFNVSPIQRIALFFCVSALCMIIGAVAVGVCMYGGVTPQRMRIATILQDVMMFVLPAIATAVVITRQSAEFLQLRRPDWRGLCLAMLTLVVAVPAMNCIIDWNQNIALPDSMKGLEEWMRASEENAASMIEVMIGGSGIGSLVVSILIAGLLAGFSEEIFFRGALQRLIATFPVNIHVAVWVSAVIFSAVHMQFYGFVPRLLLGAFFGYVVAWSGSLWVSVAIHSLNNILASVEMWMNNNDMPNQIDSIGAGGASNDWILVGVSLILTVILLRCTYVAFRKNISGQP